MSNTAMGLIKAGLLQSGGGAAPYTEQGVTADGTQKLDFGGVASGSDSAASLFFASFDTSTDARNVLAHWGNANSSGHWGSDNDIGDGFLDPVGKYQFTGAGDYAQNTGDVALGRVHMLWSTEASGSDVIVKYGIWTSGTGWTTGSATRPGAGSVSFNTEGDNLILLQKRNNSSQYVGDIHRMALWVGTTADATSSATHNLFTSSGVTIDPATALASLGDTNRVFDAFGDKDVWDSGDFSSNGGKGVFTKTGNAFVDV